MNRWPVSVAVNTLRLRVCRCALILAMLCATMSSESLAQEVADGPPPAHYLSLTQLDAYLEWKGDFSNANVETTRRSGFRRDFTQRNRETRFEERLGLRIGGSVLDPRFITFGGEINFGLTQERFTEELGRVDQTDRDTGRLLQYDLRANFFPGKRLSGSMYGLRQDDRISRRFQPTLDRTRTGFGLNWVFQHDTFPMELSYDYLETDRTGNRDRRDDEHFTESTFHYAVDWNINAHNRIKSTYEHADTKQEYQGLRVPFETIRDLFTVEHQLEFGPDRKNRLRTFVHWQEESGDFARDFFEIGPQLTLTHNDHLQTLYKYQFNQEKFEGLDIDTHRADFQLVHQLYSNLTTTVDIFGLYEDVEGDINTTQYGGSVDWQYNRRNRFGHLYANLALAYDTEDVDGNSGTRVILDEAQTFHDPVAITLRNRNVVPTGIVVTDTSNRRVFQSGVDYIVVRLGTATRLERVRSGRIADGDTVLVDYRFRTPANGRLNTIRTDFSIEQRFTNGWTPYYRLSYRDQDDDVSTGSVLRQERTDHHRLGARYEAKRYTFSTEYEIFDDAVEPYDAFHLNGLVHLLNNPEHTLDVSSRFSRFFFEGGVDRRNVTMIDMGVDHRRRWGGSLSTVERVAYRFQDDSVEGNTVGWDATAGFEYVTGDLSGELVLEYNQLDLPGPEENDFGVYFRLRRELPHRSGRSR